MSLRPGEIREVVAELSELLGSVVQKAHAPRPKLAYLELRRPGQSVLLCLSAEPSVARISVAQDRPAGEPSALQRVLRSGLIGFKLAAVSFVPASSVILEFERGEAKRRLWLDCAGGHLSLQSEPFPSIEERSEPPGESRLVPMEGAAFPRAEAAELLLGLKASERQVTEVRKQRAAPLKAKRQRVLRTLEKVRAEASRKDQAEQHRIWGELLTQNLHGAERGASSIRVTAYTERGEEAVDVPLDPRRSPKDQALWHFHQYRRLLRGCEHAQRRLGELESEREELDRELAWVENAPLDDLLSQAAPAPRPKGPQRAQPFKEYVGAGGQKIWVGKGGAANDELTFRKARPHDMWIHARGVPGAHVVVPLERNAELSQDVLVDAAHLAIHHSSAKGEVRAEVQYARAKFIRKQKGAAPGQVIVSQEKTFVVRMESDRLDRLLRSRG